MSKEPKNREPENPEIVEPQTKNPDGLEFEPVKLNLLKWDFEQSKEFLGEFTGNRQTLKEAGVKDDKGNAGDIELLHFVDHETGENVGLINSGILQQIELVPGKIYKIIFRGQTESGKSGRKVNLFDVYVAK